MKTFNMDSGGIETHRTGYPVQSAKTATGTETYHLQGDYTSTLDSNLMCYRQVNSRQIPAYPFCYVGTFSYFCRMVLRYQNIAGLRLAAHSLNENLNAIRFESRRFLAFFPQSEYVSVLFPEVFYSFKKLSPSSLANSRPVTRVEGWSFSDGIGIGCTVSN